ncbi:MAG TPA: type II toxin-antitoxin system prevent-host-death family antitoxin [Streptomyces sp.]|nr:type II toxin-antitoxin system prevent-host-death family antitoxin [Streptomyces sp.]
MTDEPNELSVREFRAQMADVLNETAIRSQITYITNRGRRVAAVVPVAAAEAEEERRRS